MKIIIPNAKELNTNLDNAPFRPLSKFSLPILNTISKLNQEDLSTLYKLSLEKTQVEWERWQRIQLGQAKSYPAWQLYDGLMYRYMNRRDLTYQEEIYLYENVRIATSLYGLIQPFEMIAPHRLDFQTSLKIGSQSLKQYWRPYYDKEMETEKVILSLASSEFEQVFSSSIQSRLLKIKFMEEKEGKLRTHSTISKKGRGRMLSWLAKYQIQNWFDIKEFNLDGFNYNPEKSTTDYLVFVREV